MNPYQILKVRQNASRKTIDKAYRKMALVHHPDRGGSPEKFQPIQAAYELLTDAERRKRYDETGDTVAPPAPDVAGMLFRMLADLCTKPSTDLNLVRVMEQTLAEARRNGATMLEKLSKERDRLQLMADRFTVNDDHNLPAGVCRNLIAVKEAEAGKVMAQLRSAEAALEYLKKCKYTGSGPTATSLWQTFTVRTV